MNRKYKFINVVKLLASIVFLQSMATTVADDTELFFADKNSSEKPNLLFVMDVSGSMNKKMDASKPDSKTRLATMQSALRTVLTSAPNNLNVGLMEYGELQQHWGAGLYPSGISFPISDIEALAYPIVADSLDKDGLDPKWWQSKIPEPTAIRTVREYISDITDNYFKDSWYRKEYEGASEDDIAMPRYGNTPIVDALYEAARYFRGDKLYFGQRDVSHHKAKWSGIGRAAHPSTYEGEAIRWDENLCEYDKFDDNWKWTWREFSSTDKYNSRWSNGSGSWDNSNKCAVDINNAKASPATVAACETNEVCTDWWTEAKPAKSKKWVCHKEYEDYCPVDTKTGENGKEYCPGGYESRRTYPDRCHWHEATPAKPSKQKWDCKIPKCTGALTREPNYTSPIKNVCQTNFIVLMSDGKPQYSSSYDDNGNSDGTNTPGIVAERLTWGSDLNLDDKSDNSNVFNQQSCSGNPKPSGYASGKCGPELTQFLATSDQMGGEKFVGKQTINTFAIGFGLDPDEVKADEYLESLVTTDIDPDTGRKFGYFIAQNEVTLAKAFDDVVKRIGVTTDALAASGYSVNVKNGVAHNSDIYVPVFRRKETPTWSGNLKKFKIAKVDGKRKIVDKNGIVAMDELGVFQADVQDLWSTTKDGAKVEAGGVANLLKDAAQRNLLTNSSSGKTLQKLKVSNTAVNYSVLGLNDADKTPEYREKLIRFIRGERYEPDTGDYVQRKHMGDMMHSDPVVITYNKNYESSGVEGGQVLYIGTNEGYLHAFDTTSGKELFAFMPKKLLRNIDKQYKNANESKHVYGVDGPISVWNKIDKNDATKNKHYIYFGLRRGGKAYYALDVTNPLDPKLQWKLDKNTVFGGKKVFDKIGQSWSRADMAKIRMDKKGTMKDVVIFSGGYDTNQDKYADKTLNEFKDPSDESKGRRTKKAVDTIGKDIFIVDAIKGPTEFSWSMSDKSEDASALKHSVPGGVRGIDLNRDGAIDRVYFADMGGNVWRLEMPTGPDFNINTKNATKLIKLAKLGDGSGDIEGRKFYSEPDVSLLNDKGESYLSISIGSGYRAHPLYEGGLKNNFYVLIDQAVHSKLETDTSKPDHFTTIKSANLEKLKASIANKAFTLNTGRLTADKNIIDLMKETNGAIRGWALELPSKGEKVLATSITRDGKLVFTSLAPNTDGEEMTSENECGAPMSQGRAYVLDLLSSQATVDLNDDGGDPNVADIMKPVTDNTIPNSPQAIFAEPECNTTTRKCTQNIGLRVDKKASALLDEALDYLEPRYWSDPVMKAGE